MVQLQKFRIGSVQAIHCNGRTTGKVTLEDRAGWPKSLEFSVIRLSDRCLKSDVAGWMLQIGNDPNSVPMPAFWGNDFAEKLAEITSLDRLGRFAYFAPTLLTPERVLEVQTSDLLKTGIIDSIPDRSLSGTEVTT